MTRPYVSVEGVGRLDEALGMVALDGFGLSPPEVQTRLVDVPGRWPLDLTDALGGPFYGLRRQTLRFLVEAANVEAAKGRALSALHGRRLRYSLSVDPGHTYVGRWSVTGSAEWHGQGACVLTCEVACDPYRYRDRAYWVLNPIGGRWYTFPSGDMPVRPSIHCATPVWVQDEGGRVSRFAAGDWRMNDVLFHAGDNRLYVSSWTVRDTTWGYVAPDGPHPLKWGDLKGMTWGELSRLAGDSGVAARTWGDLRGMRWGDLDGRWGDLGWGPSSGTPRPDVDTTVYIDYEIGDL